VSDSLFEQYKAALRRGHMAALAGELDEALAAYDAAGRLVPDRALPLASRGTILHRLDRWPEATAAFEQALQLAPDDEAALRARATARAERDLRSGAAADFERLAFVLDVAGRAGPAAEAARRAGELEPSQAREALADRLAAAAAQRVELPTADATAVPGAAGGLAIDPWSAALDARRLEGFELTPEEASAGEPPPLDAAVEAGSGTPRTPPSPANSSVAYDMLDSLRAGLDAEEPPEQPLQAPAVSAALESADGIGEAGPDGPLEGGAWPPIDLPSPPPPPMVGPPPDPEEVLAEAALVLEAGEVDAARDLMLRAASVHRAAGRIDAALDVCLNLLSIAPGDPRVHLAIANLQLDRGWNSIATEKLALLVRLTSLTGDTQAEADVHGLASERLRDDPAPSAAAR
jgi:tetratricopeptide (TPR) repeat protein